jgi:L-arabinokinase
VPAVFFYISGHGFGHASRQIEIIDALGAAAPGLQIVVRTSAPRWLFDRTVRTPITLVAGACDTGVVQHDSLRLDDRTTVERAAEFHRTLERRAAGEADLLRQSDARLVVADAPPLGCAAARAADLPAVVVSNFTWDWIYEEYAEHLPAAPGLLPAISQAYGHAAEAWRLPMHGGFRDFGVVRDVPFVARHAGREPEDVRRLLDLPAFRPLILSSFGGYGVDGLSLASLDCLDDFDVVVTAPDGAGPPPVRGVHVVREPAMYARGLRYEDLVRAVDVVLTKPGYGIIAECIANGTAMLYTSRGRFREYDVLVAEIPRFLRAAFIDHEALFAGRWRSALEWLGGAGDPPERPDTRGADTVAALILERL